MRALRERLGLALARLLVLGFVVTVCWCAAWVTSRLYLFVACDGFCASTDLHF